MLAHYTILYHKYNTKSVNVFKKMQKTAFFTSIC